MMANCFDVGTYDDVRPHGHGYGSLRRLAQRQAWDPEHSRFFLEPPGVGKNEACTGSEGQEIEVAERLGENQIRHRPCLLEHGELLKALLGSWSAWSVIVKGFCRRLPPRVLFALRVSD